MGKHRNVKPSAGTGVPPPLVAIGASAGGIEALRVLLPTLPTDLPAAVAIVLHRSAARERDRLVAVLGASSRLPLTLAADGDALEPGRIAIGPGGVHLTVEGGCYRLRSGPHENGLRPAVDVLFRSASEALGPRAIGVVLSGTLDDGTAGLAAIKARGGIALVQDPQDAAFAGMPGSAIENVVVDAVSPAAELGHFVAEFAHQAAQRAASSAGAADVLGSPSLFSCPDCGGVLSEVDANGVVVFRCRTGHAYGPRTLYSEQGSVLDEALWYALRALVERIDLSERLARRSRDRGLPIAAERFEHQAADARHRADIVRAAIGDAAAAREAESANEIVEEDEDETSSVS